MPAKLKAQIQAELALLTEFLYAAAVLAEDYDNEELGDDPVDENRGDVDEIIELAALNSLASVLAMSGDGSRGQYNNTPQSKDFFSVCLSSSDRRFRHLYRSVLLIMNCSMQN
jgi:hypothetical protein